MKKMVAQASRLFKFGVSPNFVCGAQCGLAFAAGNGVGVLTVSGATPETTGQRPVPPIGKI
jgi:hypothetical protein